MANREIFTPGLGVQLYPATSGTVATSNAAFANGSLTWAPAFVTTQAAWSSGVYTAASYVQTGSLVSVAGSSVQFMCLNNNSGGTSSQNPATGSGGGTTPGKVYTMSDSYVWLCIGNNTADVTNLANGYQAVSQIIIDNSPALSAGDTMIEMSVSLATGSSGAAGDSVTIGLQPLNQDGTTYGDGIGGGSNLSGAQLTQVTLPYGAGASSPIVGSAMMPLGPFRYRAFLQNSSGATLSASTHVVSFRTFLFNLNG
jgi:hypothetical protein